MKQTVFYSWQSDLPNNNNRGFIGKCIENAIKQINNDIGLEVVIDRDTMDMTGTPDIVSTIFDKIDKSKIFIADISFINLTGSGRLTPNPNVLIELGYAAKTLGWDRIICIFNKQFGKIEDLPFDLRFRRPISYHINDNKAEERKVLTKNIKEDILRMLSLDDANDDIVIYMKQQIDFIILKICGHLSKIFYDVGKVTTQNIIDVLNLDFQKESTYILYEKK